MRTCLLQVVGYAELLALVLNDDGSVSWRKINEDDVNAITLKSSAVNAVDTIQAKFSEK